MEGGGAEGEADGGLSGFAIRQLEGWTLKDRVIESMRSAGAARHPVGGTNGSVALVVRCMGGQVEAVAGHQPARRAAGLGEPHLALHHQGVGLERVRVHGYHRIGRSGALQHFVVAGAEHLVAKHLEAQGQCGHGWSCRPLLVQK